MSQSTAAYESLIAKNRLEYGDRYTQLRFLSPPQRVRAEARRQELLSALEGRVETGFGGTKLDCTHLSPGCRICGEGGWSCLFINGRCNVRCFYCPTSQEEVGLPTTNTVEFRTPGDYVAYLEHFGFTGASISGGEPLLTPGRTLAYIAAIKKRFGSAMHVWLYTNGTLVDKDNLSRLGDAGLDEIRFDIGAVDYRLDKVGLAVGTIPTVTVEIPAIPEDLDRLKIKTAEMANMGVNHLNLHQLRLTPFNFPRLAPRGYHFLHGERVTILESELAALELLHHAVDADLCLPVNYCSFVFKNRYQGLAARRRNASFHIKPWETLAENGYIRTLTLIGSAPDIIRQTEIFRLQSPAGENWSAGSSRERLVFHPRLWPLIEFGNFRLGIAYAACRQQPSVSYQNPFVAVKVSHRQQVVVERVRAAKEVELSGEDTARFAEFLLAGEPARVAPAGAPLAELVRFERIAEGLQDYF